MPDSFSASSRTMAFKDSQRLRQHCVPSVERIRSSSSAENMTLLRKSFDLVLLSMSFSSIHNGTILHLDSGCDSSTWPVNIATTKRETGQKKRSKSIRKNIVFLQSLLFKCQRVVFLGARSGSLVADRDGPSHHVDLCRTWTFFKSASRCQRSPSTRIQR